jgi:uncharacterized coiled-coil protein SlyX
MATDPPQDGRVLDALTARVGEQADLLERLALDLTTQERLVRQLRADVDGLLGENGGRGPSPIPAPRWHDMSEDERAEAVGRLRDWVQAVYVPVYGHFAASLGACWGEHPLACAVLDLLSETWAVLYSRPSRTQRILSAQLEFQCRYLPAAAEQLRAETASCGRHASERRRAS